MHQASQQGRAPIITHSNPGLSETSTGKENAFLSLPSKVNSLPLLPTKIPVFQECQQGNSTIILTQ